MGALGQTNKPGYIKNKCNKIKQLSALDQLKKNNPFNDKGLIMPF